MNKNMGLSKREQLREKRRRAQKQKRLLYIGIAAVLALVIAGILIYPSLTPVNYVMITPVVRPNEQGLSFGDPNAPVKVIEAADFQCPWCKTFTEEYEVDFISQYVDTGQVYFTYLPFSFLDQYDRRVPSLKESHAAAEAAYCANDQGRFWDYRDIIYANQTSENAGDFTDKRLTAFAQGLGLNMSQFNDCYTSGKYQQQIIDDYNTAINYNFTQTPSFLVDGEVVTLDKLNAAVDAALAGSSG